MLIGRTNNTQMVVGTFAVDTFESASLILAIVSNASQYWDLNLAANIEKGVYGNYDIAVVYAEDIWQIDQMEYKFSDWLSNFIDTLEAMNVIVDHNFDVELLEERGL